MTWRNVLVLCRRGAARGGLRATPIAGTATWPGARLEKVVLTAGGLPAGRAIRPHHSSSPASPTAPARRPPCCPDPEGCSDGLTRVIADSAERGPGSAAEYVVGLRRCADGHDGVDVAAGPRPAGRRRRAVRASSRRSSTRRPPAFR